MPEELEKLSLVFLAARINAHLQRFENDKVINAPRASHAGTVPYYNSWAAKAGTRVNVCYVSYQGFSCLKKAEAIAYLRKLDEGFVGRHFEALRTPKSA